VCLCVRACVVPAVFVLRIRLQSPRCLLSSSREVPAITNGVCSRVDYSLFSTRIDARLQTVDVRRSISFRRLAERFGFRATSNGKTLINRYNTYIYIERIHLLSRFNIKIRTIVSIKVTRKIR